MLAIGTKNLFMTACRATLNSLKRDESGLDHIVAVVSLLSGEVK